MEFFNQSSTVLKFEQMIALFKKKQPVFSVILMLQNLRCLKIYR